MTSATPPSPARAALKHLQPAWFSVVMGLAGLALAWHRAVPTMGDAAGAVALVLSALAAVVFVVLLVAAALRARIHPQAWPDDLKHPVRHAFVATLPVALILLATTAVAAGVHAALAEALWWIGALAQLWVTVWATSRWWRLPAGLPWASVTPALFIPIVGNVLVPLAGVPLGRPDWSAAQFGIGVMFWPVVTTLLVVRIAQQGLWAERMLPANFIFIAPPAAVGLSALTLGAPLAVGWALWGMAMFSLLWVAPLARRIADQPFGLTHWALSFPLAALTALTLQLGAAGPMAGLGVFLLALTSLTVCGLALATVRGLRSGELLKAESIPLASAPAASPVPAAAASPVARGGPGQVH